MICFPIQAMVSGSLEIEPSLLLIGKGLFGVPASFILGFFLKLSFVFIISGIMSKIFRLDKAYDEMKNQKRL